LGKTAEIGRKKFCKGKGKEIGVTGKNYEPEPIPPMMETNVMQRSGSKGNSFAWK